MADDVKKVVKNQGDTNDMNSQHLMEAFKYFDVDGSGVISRKNLVQILSKEDTGFEEENLDEIAEYIISEVDTDKNGKIELAEFLSMLIIRVNDDRKCLENLKIIFEHNS